MEKKVLSEKSPLFGRRDSQIKLEAFNYKDSALFVPDYSFEEKAICYGITGGVAKYLSMIDKTKTLDENISKILLFPKIEIITEKITTNPPIIIIVLLDSSIALESMLPKLLNVHNSLVDELYECSKILFFNLCFKRANCPNKIPTVIAESVCVINKSKPILELENIEIPYCSNYKERTRIICKTKHSFSFIFSAIIVGAQICNNFSTHRVATNKP